MEGLVKFMVDKGFWEGKRVFLTGHTGFKGAWLGLWLNSLGARVKGYSLACKTTPSLYGSLLLDDLFESHISDVRDLGDLRRNIDSFEPEIVIHMAAQPIVKYSYAEPAETFEINVMGTVNLLEACRACESVRAVINVTTDKSYENNEWHWGYRETDVLGGRDPYSSSKACSELVSTAYYKSFLQARGVGLATARAGNVIGGGDWAADRLIPDLFRGVATGSKGLIRNPNAVRPWQHVLEPLSGYLCLAEALFDNPSEFSQGWNFGPNDDDVRSVEWVADSLFKHNPKVKWEIDSSSHVHEATLLKLDISKAKALLGWSPTWTLERSLQMTSDWYGAHFEGKALVEFSLQQIEDFTTDMKI